MASLDNNTRVYTNLGTYQLGLHDEVGFGLLFHGPRPGALPELLDHPVRGLNPADGFRAESELLHEHLVCGLLVGVD